MGDQTSVILFGSGIGNHTMEFVDERRSTMYTPNSPKEEQDNLLPEWHEPFPEPNTIPSGWNFGSIVPTHLSATEIEPDEEVED